VNQVVDAARLIQLAIAPVFLLTGVSALLGVLSSRLGRTIDRARVLENLLETSEGARLERMHLELSFLARRAKLIYRAVALGVITALLICTVIAILFISAFTHVDVGLVVAALFIAAMASLITALLLFLREVFLATRVLKIGPH
jgi:MFS family permease